MTTATVGSARAAERPVANRRIAVLVGVLFLTATVTFAIGNSLIRSYFSSATSSGGTLVIGVLLLGCSALADVAIGFAMRRVLMPHAPLRAQAYFVGSRTSLPPLGTRFSSPAACSSLCFPCA